MKEKETQKILVSDQVNGFQYKTEKSDSFVVDMEGFPNGVNKDTTANSRITVSFPLAFCSTFSSINLFNSRPKKRPFTIILVSELIISSLKKKQRKRKEHF